MKSEKGITLISLTVYIIVMAIIVAVIAIITTFFYKNIENAGISIDPITEYTTFSSFFSEEINKENIRVLECGTSDGTNYIVFDNGVQYSYIPENRGIYKNKVKICRDIDSCTFSESIENGKYVIEVNFVSGNQNKVTKYTLKN